MGASQGYSEGEVVYAQKVLKSVAPRVFLTKIPFWAFPSYHGNLFFFLSPYF